MRRFPYISPLVFLALLAAALLLLPSCAPSGPHLTKSINSTKRIERLGVSFSPPPGAEWDMVDDTAKTFSNITLLQVLTPDQLVKTPSRSVLIRFSVDSSWNAATGPKRMLPHEALERARKYSYRISPTNPRLKEIEFTSTYESFHGVEALRFHQIVEDAEAPGGASHIENYGLVTFHPQSFDTVLAVTWTQRSRPKDAVPPLNPIGEAFLATIEFSKPK